MTPTQASDTAGSKRRSWLMLLVILLLVLGILPWILAKSNLRDRLLNAIVSSNEITVTSTDASLGYLSALSLSGLQINSNDDSTQIAVEHIEADHSWLGLLFARPELGTFRVANPSIRVLVDPDKLVAKSDPAVDEGTTKRSDAMQQPNLIAEIRDASVVVRTPLATEPPIDLQNIQITLRLEKQNDISMLRIDPSTVFDHQRITP